MDGEDESTAYLKFFNDTPQSFLLQNSDTLTDESFQVESIFTEIGSDWTSETFPVLLSGPLVAEDNGDSDSTNNIQRQEHDNGPSTSASNDENLVTIYGNIDKNHVILSNEVLVQVSEPNTDQDHGNIFTRVINGESHSVAYSQGNIPGEVISLVNVNPSSVKKISPKSNHRNFYDRVQAFKCSICNNLSETEYEMISHLNREHMDDVDGAIVHNVTPVKMTSILKINKNARKYMMFLCSNCGNAYSSKEDLKNHMITQHNLISVSRKRTERPGLEDNQNVGPAPKNPSKALSTRLLRKQQLAMKKVKCSVKGCSYRFARDDLRKRHEECHVDGQKKQFKCSECQQKFSIWRICSMHMWRCHSIDLGLLSCPMCNKFKAMSPLNVINHMAIHNEEKPFTCSTCCKGFKQLAQLKNHEVIHKPADELTNCYSMKKCQYCNSHFANAKSLRSHIKSVHHKFKPFICNICGHQAARKEMLQVHYRQHTGDKPFKCDYCTYKTGDRNCLRRHLMRHFGVAKYLCPYCDYQSIQSVSYKKHLANKHPGKEGIFSCDKCKYITVNVNKFSTHVHLHEIEDNNGKEDNESTKDMKQKQGSEGTNSNLNRDGTVDDEDAQNCFRSNEHSEEAVDTGGITIPAEFDLQLKT